MPEYNTNLCFGYGYNNIFQYVNAFIFGSFCIPYTKSPALTDSVHFEDERKDSYKKYMYVTYTPNFALSGWTDNRTPYKPRELLITHFIHVHPYRVFRILSFSKTSAIWSTSVVRDLQQPIWSDRSVFYNAQDI